jgi:hypothetical protein
MKIAGTTVLAADGLSLAAAPTFAFMAAVTGIVDHGAPEVLCAAMSHASALSGMVPMYVLMSAFHVGPWLKLIPRRRTDRAAELVQLSAVTSAGRGVDGVLPMPTRRLISAANRHSAPPMKNAAL